MLFDTIRPCVWSGKPFLFISMLPPQVQYGQLEYLTAEIIIETRPDYCFGSTSCWIRDYAMNRSCHQRTDGSTQPGLTLLSFLAKTSESLSYQIAIVPDTSV